VLSDGSNPLTERERNALAHIDRDVDDRDIADRLSLSEGTVRNHLSAAIQKLGARNRAEAARDRSRQGLVLSSIHLGQSLGMLRGHHAAPSEEVRDRGKPAIRPSVQAATDSGSGALGQPDASSLNRDANVSGVRAPNSCRGALERLFYSLGATRGGAGK
jgi:DNA-binding CsgD family transcriptional regulator